MHPVILPLVIHHFISVSLSNSHWPFVLSPSAGQSSQAATVTLLDVLLQTKHTTASSSVTNISQSYCSVDKTCLPYLRCFFLCSLNLIYERVTPPLPQSFFSQCTLILWWFTFSRNGCNKALSTCLDLECVMDDSWGHWLWIVPE